MQHPILIHPQLKIQSSRSTCCSPVARSSLQTKVFSEIILLLGVAIPRVQELSPYSQKALARILGSIHDATSR